MEGRRDRESGLDMESRLDTGSTLDMDKTGVGNMQTILMDRAYIDEHDVVQRFIRRSLTDAELTQFEIYMLENGAIVDEIEQQKMLNQIFREELIRANSGSGSSEGNWESNREDSEPGRIAAAQNPLHRFRSAIALAACLVLALYVGINTVDTMSVRNSQQTVTLGAVVLQDLRGASTGFSAMVPASVPQASRVSLPLKIDVGPQLESVVTYNVSLSSGQTLVAEQQNLRATVDGWLELTMTLPSASPASYRIDVVETVSGDSRSYSLSLNNAE